MKRIGLLFTLMSFAVLGFAQPKIQFDQTTHDFGSIKEEGGKVTGRFTFKNVGDSTLLLTRVKPGCGCTAANYTKTPIEPGQTGFIDATYEGDLMAISGVSYHVGREDSSVYGEKWNGSHISVYHQFPDGVDPFVERGKPESGLLWGIQDWTLKEEGQGDRYVQAYNYRVCMTQDKANQIPITRPADYDSTRYELLVRVFEADPNPTVDKYFIWSMMPGGKTDINNRGAFSTDMIGMNHDYPEASWERRREIIAAHKNYTLGLFYFYATDPRVPANLQDWVRSWGYAKDEYPKTGGWTHQLYVREARRMVGEYVATQADCEGLGNVTDGIGYAAYQMDSHNCERIVVMKDGKYMVKNEGDVVCQAKVCFK